MQLEALRSAFAMLPDAILVVDERGRVLCANASAEALFGFAEDELLARTVEDLVPERLRARHARHRATFAAAPRARPMGSVQELVALRSDGTELPVDISLGPLTIEGHKLVVATVRDASQRTSVERELRTIVEGVAAATGADFLRSLVRYLAAALGVRHALVGALTDEGGDSVRTLAAWSGDGYAESFTFRLTGTTAEEELRKQLGTEACLALPLSHSSGRPLGLIAAADDKPLSESGPGEAILRIFAARAAAELERVHSEQAQRDCNSRFRAIFEEAPVGIVVFDSEGRIVESNRTFCELTGYTAEELKQLPRAAYTHPDDLPAHLELWKQMLAGERDRYELEKRYVRKDGTLAWGHVIAATVHRGPDMPPFRFSIVQDITERKAAEDQLRLANERFELAALAAQAAVYDWDPHSDRGVLSRGFTDIFGYADEDREVTHAWWLENVHPDDRERSDAAFRESVGTGASYACEYRLRAGDGGYRDVLDRALVLRDETGRVTRMVGAILDLTERKQLEARLRQFERMEALGQLAGGIAHDFNNILSVITGYGELLLARLDENDPRRAEVAEIVRAGESGAALTRQLVAYSRGRPVKLELLDVNAVVERSASMLGRLLGGHIELVLRLAPSLRRIKADAGQLEQVIVNLAVNARDAMPDGGALTIETGDMVVNNGSGAAGAHIVLRVSDTGLGLDVETRAKIFEPFFTTKGARGTGLGLATVARIVSQSSGSIHVESEPGQGATFELCFPAVQEAPAATETARAEPQRRIVATG